MNNPRRKPRVSELCHENYLQSVTPECFYRGSTMLTTTLSQVEGSGVQSRVRLDFTSTSSVWRAQSHRLKHAGMTDFGERRFTQRSKLRESTQRNSKMQSELPKVARTHREKLRSSSYY